MSVDKVLEGASYRARAMEVEVLHCGGVTLIFNQIGGPSRRLEVEVTAFRTVGYGFPLVGAQDLGAGGQGGESRGAEVSERLLESKVGGGSGEMDIAKATPIEADYKLTDDVVGYAIRTFWEKEELTDV